MPTSGHQDLQGFGEVSYERWSGAIVNSPHDSEGRAPNLIKWLPPGNDLPENDTPAEHITFLTVVAAFKDLRSHPCCTPLVVCHVRLDITGRAKVTDL